MPSPNYITIGILIIIFIFELIIIGYVYFCYTQTTNNIYDTQDLLLSVYNLEILEATNAGIDTCILIPKRIRERTNPKKCRRGNESGSTD